MRVAPQIAVNCVSESWQVTVNLYMYLLDFILNWIWFVFVKIYLWVCILNHFCLYWTFNWCSFPFCTDAVRQLLGFSYKFTYARLRPILNCVYNNSISLKYTNSEIWNQRQQEDCVTNQQDTVILLDIVIS